MKKTYLILLSILLISCQEDKQNLVEYVNPFIGTGGHGHTYPGVSAPFGMVQLSPDTRLEGWDGCLLYTSPSPRDNLPSRMPSSA